MNSEQITKRAHELENVMRSMRRSKLIPKAESGLKGSEMHFIWVLATLNKGEPVMPSEAAKTLGVTLAAITHNINSLEEKGFITRTASPTDKRAVYISLSPKGKEMVRSLKDSHFEKIRGLVEYLGDKDSAELIALMMKVSQYFNSLSEPADTTNNK